MFLAENRPGHSESHNKTKAPDSRFLNVVFSLNTYFYIVQKGYRDARTPQTVRETRMQRIFGKLAGTGQVLRLPGGQYSSVTRRQHVSET